MAFTKITPADRIGKGNVGQADTPGLTTSEMQELMDSLPNLAIDKFNNHIDELGMESAATNIGATPPDGILANKNIQSILNTLAYQLGLVEVNNHSHSNKETLDEITGEYKTSLDTLLLLMNNINSIATTISSSSTDSELPTAKAIVDLLDDTFLHSAVMSFNDRVGRVYPNAGDYTADQITYDATNVKAVLDLVRVMTGATASADGVGGLVPKPNAGDQGKILYGNGAWGNPPINYLSGLQDVSLNALQNNQSLVYDFSSAKWIDKLAQTIFRIQKTSTSGLVDTYTITYIDGSTDTFTVTNGKPAYQSAVEGGYPGTEAEFESDLANMEEYAASAAQSAIDAANSASLAEQYADFVTPHFIIQDNVLYLKDDSAGEFLLEDNKLYVKITG